MNVSIGPRWEEFVSKAVETGRYGSASEVVREAAEAPPSTRGRTSG